VLFSVDGRASIRQKNFGQRGVRGPLRLGTQRAPEHPRQCLEYRRDRVRDGCEVDPAERGAGAWCLLHTPAREKPRPRRGRSAPCPRASKARVRTETDDQLTWGLLCPYGCGAADGAPPVLQDSQCSFPGHTVGIHAARAPWWSVPRGRSTAMSPRSRRPSRSVGQGPRRKISSRGGYYARTYALRARSL